MMAAVDRALTMMDEKATAIRGHGPLSTRADVERSVGTLQASRERGVEMIAWGRDREVVWATRPSKAFDAAFGGGFMKPDRFTGTVYSRLVVELR